MNCVLQEQAFQHHFCIEQNEVTLFFSNVFESKILNVSQASERNAKLIGNSLKSAERFVCLTLSTYSKLLPP